MSVAFDSNVTLTVEIAFDSNPLDTNPTFTDVSSFVRSFDVKRGRNNELGQFPAGTLQVVFSNADNALDSSKDDSLGCEATSPLSY